MRGIDLNQPLIYLHASMRVFGKNERHITRDCSVNVLLLVLEGVLRFSEDGEPAEVRAGEFYIQRKNRHQTGDRISDEPRYLYAHFDGEWTEGEEALPERGSFNAAELMELMEELDAASHEGRSYSELQYLFLKLMLSLRRRSVEPSVAKGLADFVEQNLERITSLSDLCDALHYSKNYVIRLFQRELGASPFQYVNEARIRRASYLLETTSRPLAEIARACGYSDYAYFYKRFLRAKGESPSQWRKRMQREPFGGGERS